MRTSCIQCTHPQALEATEGEEATRAEAADLRSRLAAAEEALAAAQAALADSEAARGAAEAAAAAAGSRGAHLEAQMSALQETLGEVRQTGLICLSRSDLSGKLSGIYNICLKSHA